MRKRRDFGICSLRRRPIRKKLDDGDFGNPEDLAFARPAAKLPLYHVRFDLPTDQLPEFKKELKVEAPGFSSDLPSLMSRAFARVWWCPMQATRFEAADLETAPRGETVRIEQILIDESVTRDCRVYVVVLDTNLPPQTL